MADEKEKGSDELPSEEIAPKGKKKKLIIIAAAVVLLLGGGGVGAMMFLGGDDMELAAKAPGEAGDATPPMNEDGTPIAKDGEKADPSKKTGAAPSSAMSSDFGCTYTLKPFHLNLGNPLEDRYLRLEVAIEHACNEALKAELEKRSPQLRDAVIGITSKKTREFLLGPDGKAQLRKEVLTRINHYMGTKIEDVFITDILIE